MRSEELRADVANISEMVRARREKDRGICSNENMAEGSEWTPTYGTTETDV